MVQYYDTEKNCENPKIAIICNDDVEEFFGSELRAEAGFGDDDIGESQSRFGSSHAVAAVGDVCERPAVDKGGGMLKRLHQIGVHGVLEQGRHRPLRLQLSAGDRLFVAGVAHNNPGKILL